MQDANITFRADISSLRRQLGEIPGVTETEAKRMVSALSKQLKRAEREAKKSWKSQSKAAGEYSKKLNALDDTMMALQLGPMADLFASARYMTDAVDDIGMASVAAAGGFALAGAAAVGLAAGMVASVAAADDLARELQAFKDIEGFGISAEDLAAIDAANASLSAVMTVLKQIVVDMGTEFAPTVEAAGKTMVAFALIAQDTFRSFSEGHDVMKELAVFMTTKMVQAMTGPLLPLSIMVKTMAAAADAVGMDGVAGALRSATDAYDDFAASIARNAVDYYWDEGAESLHMLTGLTGDYMERAEELVDIQLQVNAAKRDGAKNSKDQAEEIKEETAAVVEQTTALQQFIDMHEVAAGGLAEIATMIGGPVTGAVVALVQDLEDTINDLGESLVALPDQLARAPEAMAGLYTTIARDVIPAITQELPGALIESITSPEVWGAVVELHAALLRFALVGWIDVGKSMAQGAWDRWTEVWNRFASGAMREAAEEWWDSVKDGIRDFAERLWEAIKQIFKPGELLADAGQATSNAVDWLADAATELVTLGGADTASFGDTPGVIQAGPAGMGATFAGGDYVVASRTMEGLLTQILTATQARSGGSASAAPARRQGTYRQRLRDFEGFQRDSQLLAGSTARTGRANPYRRS